MLERNELQNLIGTKVDNTVLPISVAECAEFSLRIYDTLSPPPDWALIASVDDNITGYRGACYGRNLVTQNAQVVFVHRGTVLNLPNVIGNIANIIGDIATALGKIFPLQYQSLGKLAEDYFMTISKIYKVTEKDGHPEMLAYLKIIHTGHSLGAIFADCSTQLGTHSVTFENPGAKPILIGLLNAMNMPVYLQQQLLNNLRNCCYAYQAGVNMINTCNEQVGRTFRIRDLDYKYKLNLLGVMAFPPSPSYFSNFTYSIDNTFDQHSIVKIKKYLRKGHASLEIVNPIGFQSGYIEYVNPDNKDYWNGFFNEVWKSDSLLARAIRLKYNDVAEFKVHGFQQLTLLYNELSKKATLVEQPKEKLFDSQLNLFGRSNHNQEIDAIINDFTLVEEATAQKVITRTPCAIM